ncbi:MAG TPA: hypothetical protein VHR41_14775 [Gemmatimonadales bacterium]|jgi:hypothetical protein|nr:hypothetical protein [Gemmatimonadales bacterium]
MTALSRLLEGSIDYAGLFPPAALELGAAVRQYASYRDGEQSWALGRFVIPVSRLSELEASAAGLMPPQPSERPWRLTALVGLDTAADARVVGEFNCRHAAHGAPGAVTDAIEAKADTVAAVDRLLGSVPDYLQTYVEIPITQDPTPLVEEIARHGERAKVRTGGITAAAFPTTADLARFIRVCAEANVPFKATAGLHHALRGDYPLTYAPDSSRGRMFGFLNVFLAGAYALVGMDAATLKHLLEETSPAAFDVTDDAITWRGHRLDLGAIRRARELVVAFGSCSFTEPTEETARWGTVGQSEARWGAGKHGEASL